MGTLIYDPDMTITVVDQSIPELESDTPALDTSLSALFAGFTSKGKHNTIVECRSPSELLNEFGDDFGNFEKYGQSNLTALNFTRSGGRAFFCSLLPEDAKRAYCLFGVSVKEKKDIQVYERTDTVYNEDQTEVTDFGTGAFVLDPSGNKIKCMVKESSMAEEKDKPVTTTGVEITVGTKTLEEGQPNFDDEGRLIYSGEPIVSQEQVLEDSVTTTFYPLFGIYYYSAGKGGNEYAFKIDRDTGRDKKMTDGRRYFMTFFKLLSSGSYAELYDEPYYFAFNPKAKYAEDSNVIEGLSTVYLNDDESGKELPIQMVVYDENYTKLTTALKAHKDEDEDVNDIDFINAIFKNGNPYTKIVLSPQSIDVSQRLITMTGGTDGSIEVGASVAETLETVSAESAAKKKEELLQKFFTCDIDDAIFDEKIVDADVLYDCNYPDTVKKTILQTFSQYRPDISLSMDLGFTKDYNDAINKANILAPYVNTGYNFMASFSAHSGTLNDPRVGSPYKVTGTYDLACSEADNFSKVGGAFQMHAGATRGKVNYLRPTWIAKKNKASMIEKLRDINLNYIEALNKNNTLIWGSESSQYHADGSKLCSNRNALVIGRAMRICHKILPYYKYDERDIGDTLKAAGRACDDALMSSNIPTTIGITTSLYQTKQDKREENAHCDITFVFPNYAKSFTVTIIAKRPTVEE